ncbi:MAG: LemA family protein [Alphaproteobacteria bacterium]|nr:LemA family protein [Alphaproteobacteria bacterium]
MTGIGIFLGLLVLIALYVISVYNALVSLQVRTKESWSGVETHLKRRYDLIPNLVETVKGYAKHEEKTLTAVISARNMAMNAPAQTVQKEQYENMLTGALKSLFAVTESYPDLKANQSFLQLQTEIAETESRIQNAREGYNSVVSDLNQRIRVFPSNFIAQMFGISEERFFELEDSEREAAKKAPKVQF